MSKEKPLTVQDLVEALENFPEPQKYYHSHGSFERYYAHEIEKWLEVARSLVAKLKKQLEDTSEKEVDRINDLIREKAKTIRLVSRDEKTAFVCGFKIGHSTRTQELLEGRNKP